MIPGGLVARCPRCHRHHLPDLRCWAGPWIKDLRALVFDTYGTDCWLCGQPGADTTDHVRSRATGGTDALDNLRPAHRFCNTGRGAATPRPPTLRTENNRAW